MGAYKANIDKLRSKLNNNYQPIIVALDIEYIVLIAYIVNRVESIFYVSKCLPLAAFHFPYPILDG